MSFADKLKAYRRMRDYTQDQLGDEINVSQKTISSWETGRSEPTIKELTALCDLFNCTLADLSDTRGRDVGEITMEDIFERIKTASLNELEKLSSEINDRMKILAEIEATKREHDILVKRIQEYERRIKELEGGKPS